MAELLEGRLGTAIREAIGAAGATSADELETILYEPGAPILELTPPMPDGRRPVGAGRAAAVPLDHHLTRPLAPGPARLVRLLGLAPRPERGGRR